MTYEVSISKRTLRLITLASVLSGVVFPQAPPSIERRATFHIHGTIYGPRNSAASHVNVKFVGAEITKIVVTDDKGRYAADLPTGRYSMIAEVPKTGSVKFSPVLSYFRPVFLVDSARTVTADGKLYFARPTCDLTVMNKSGESPTQDQLEQATKNLCGGEDLFSGSSAGEAPFQIYFRYPKRQLSGQGFVYVSDRIYKSEPAVPVFVAYNLFSLEANEVSFDVRDRTLTATGDVSLSDGSGKMDRLNSISLRLEGGRTVPIGR